MEIRRYPNYFSGKLMPWAKGVVVKDVKGFVFLSGTTGIDPESPDIKLHEEGASYFPVVEGAEAQTRLCLEKIKSRLEEMGSSLKYMIKMTCYIVGTPDFPEGVGNSPNWLSARKAMNEFFEKHCPDLCFDYNPPNIDLIGVAGLGRKNMLIEIATIAALAD
ncbi:MAG: RidA family protein [Dehalococcoidia bacterium]